MNHEILTPEERAEYDALLYESGYDDQGNKRPSAEIGPWMHALLENAERAGRSWAGWVIADDVEVGHLSRFKRWDRVRQVVNTRHGDQVVLRSAVMAVQCQNAETGKRYWQDTFWRDMGRAELMDVLLASRVRSESEEITQATAARLLRLLDETGCALVSEALASIGMTIDEYLTDGRVA